MSKLLQILKRFRKGEESILVNRNQTNITMGMQASNRRVALLISLCLLLATTTTMCSASKLRGPKRKQRVLAKTGKEQKIKGSSIAKVESFDEEEALFYGDEESLPNEISHESSYDDPEALEHSGLGGMEGNPMMEHNSEKAPKGSDNEEEVDVEPEVEVEVEEELEVEPEVEPEPALAVKEEEPVQSNKGKGKEKASDISGTSLI